MRTDASFWSCLVMGVLLDHLLLMVFEAVVVILLMSVVCFDQCFVVLL